MQAWVWLLLGAIAIVLPCAAWAGEICSAAPDDFASIQRNERTGRYLRGFDLAAEHALKTLDPETGLIRVPGLMKPDQFDWSLAGMDRFERKRRITPEYSKFYTLSRVSASVIGLLGEAYALPLSRFYRNREALGLVKKGLEAFRAHQDASGEWIFCPIRFSTVYGSHEMAWRLEPLLRAYVSVKADLESEERDRYERMLRRAADFLLRTPCTDRCNRGVVWAGVMALAHAMIGKQEYLEAARRNWALVAPTVFRNDGQVLEGPGPDHVYSPVSMRYAFLYRLMSGDGSVDEVLIRSLRWALRLYDSNGVPFTGMSTRRDVARGDRLDGYLPLLEYYAAREPLFDRLAGDYLQYLESRSVEFAWPHGGAYALRAALFHGARPDVRGAEVPEYFEVYEADVSIYAAVRRQYQTVINLGSRMNRNGLQMWTYGRDKPVVCPTGDLASGTETWGYGSWFADVRDPSNYQTWHSDLDALAVERSGHYDFYVFSPVSTVVIYASPLSQRKTRWVMARDSAPEPVIEEGRIGFAGQPSLLYYAGGRPTLRETRNARLLEFERDLPFDWYAFSGGPFRQKEVCEPVVGAIALGFADTTGTYLALANPSRLRWKGKVTITWPEQRILDAVLGDKEVRVIRLGARAE
jgi:hypothetical protein